ncbi:hypothetical protein HYALB_00006993 [Hymenoscyphus albidus]|uniref:Phosphoglycerate mutase-like protein n=1 Tax=Hymenoscyphus albidus TaxID=595503 RepID=A0A9N9LJH2_9HELO|nr:hypothetical protein HYALB_00006993 [Hymenoscyphus albidus]
MRRRRVPSKAPEPRYLHLLQPIFKHDRQLNNLNILSLCGGMRLLFIRHGETVDNVAALYSAGVRDSALTNHGILQAKRLGSHLVATGVKVSHIFSSDLQRAVVTAEAIRAVQVPPPKTTQLAILREQDFGNYEGRPYSELRMNQNANSEVRNIPGFKDVESKPAMQARMESFIDLHLAGLIAEGIPGLTVVVVAHGIILSHLWRCLLNRFHSSDVVVSPNALFEDRGLGLQRLGRWSNTGVLDLQVKRKAVPIEPEEPRPMAEDTLTEGLQVAPTVVPAFSPPTQPTLVSTVPSPTTRAFFTSLSLSVIAINNQDHLQGLKKTRGGIGSLKHDSSQRTMDSFIRKKPRVE